jgi:hypothetical protein
MAVLHVAVAVASGCPPRVACDVRSFCNNSLGDEGVTALASGLRGLRHLEFLSLTLNDIDFEGAAALAPVLSSLGSLEHLSLGNNHLSEAGLAAIAPALKSTTCLTHLSYVVLVSTCRGVIALLPLTDCDCDDGCRLRSNELDSSAALTAAACVQSCAGYGHTAPHPTTPRAVPYVTC